MEKLTINSSVKQIQVNAAGEYISFDTRDEDFKAGIMDIVQSFEAQRAECVQRAADIEAMPAGTDAERLAQMTAAVEFSRSLSRRLMEQIDAVFKDEVCRKTFGPITPSLDALGEFFVQLAPIIRTAQEERRDKTQKYLAKYQKK